METRMIQVRVGHVNDFFDKKEVEATRKFFNAFQALTTQYTRINPELKAKTQALWLDAESEVGHVIPAMAVNLVTPEGTRHFTFSRVLVFGEVA